MPKTVTETAVDDQLNISFRLTDPKQGGSLQERLHAEVLVAYTRSDQPNIMGTTVVFKLAGGDMTVKGSHPAWEAFGFHGDLAKNRLTEDECEELIGLLQKLNALGRECTGL